MLVSDSRQLRGLVPAVEQGLLERVALVLLYHLVHARGLRERNVHVDAPREARRVEGRVELRGRDVACVSIRTRARERDTRIRSIEQKQL